MNSCGLGALRTPRRVQSTSALERDRLVFGRYRRFKWSVGLNEEDRIMGRIDQHHRDFPPLFQLLLFHPHLPLPGANFDYLSAIQGSNAVIQTCPNARSGQRARRRVLGWA